MDLDWLWKPFSALQEAVEEQEGEAQATTLSKSIPRPEKINDHVYEIHKPKGRPSVELVFFHGLQLDPASSGDAHINTWITRDKSACWLTWLLEEIPEARILTISYDGAARTTDREGTMDMYVTTENIVHALTASRARVGQDGCPVVLVGHCLGGLVMKEVCSQAHRMVSLINHSKPVENFLANVKGFFFYATPHHGSLLADTNKRSLKAPLIKALRTLEVHTARRNEEFHKLRISRGWQTCGVVGLLPVTIKFYDFKGGIIVPEASARSDMDDFYAASVDHYNICRPVNKQSSTYQQLSDFACRLVKECLKVDVPSEEFEDGCEATPYAELSPLTVGVLKAVMGLLYGLHILGMFVGFVLIAFSSISTMSNPDWFKNTQMTGSNPADWFQKVGSDQTDRFQKTGSRTFISIIFLVFFTVLSMFVTPFSCVYLLRFCITKRWVHPGQLAFELNFQHPLIDKSGFSPMHLRQEVVSRSDRELGDELDHPQEWTVVPDHDIESPEASMTSIP